MFNDTWLDWMDTGHMAMIREFGLAFLTRASKVKADRIPEWFAELLAEVTRTLKGFLGLIGPSPQAGGSTDADVQYLRDKATGGGLALSSLAAKKAIARRLKKVQAWTAMAAEYDDTAGVTKEEGPKLLTLEATARALADKMDAALGQGTGTLEEGGIDIGAAMAGPLEKFAGHIRTWQTNLRAGATIDLEGQILRVVKHLVSAARGTLEAPGSDVNARSTALKRVESLGPLLKLCSTPAAADLIKEALDINIAWADQDRMSQLALHAEQLVSREDVDACLVAQFHGALAAAKGQPKRKPVLDALLKALPKIFALFGTAATEVVSPLGEALSPAEEALAVFAKIFDLYTEEQALCDLIHGTTRFQGYIKHLTTTGTACVKLMASFAELRAAANADLASALRPAVLHVVDCIKARPKHMQEPQELQENTVLASLVASAELIVDKADTFMSEHSAFLYDMVSRLRVHAVELVGNMAMAVEAVAGGGEDGQLWHAGFTGQGPGAILAYFQETLNKNTGVEMERVLANAVEAP